MAGSARLGDDALELVDLRLGTAESTELDHSMLVYCLFFSSFLALDGSVIEGRGDARKGGRLTLFLASLRARLSRLLRSNSITRRS